MKEKGNNERRAQGKSCDDRRADDGNPGLAAAHPAARRQQQLQFLHRGLDAGSRNKFHKHPEDQILIITEGTGKVVTDDESLTVTEGDVVVIPAGENHWHGAPDSTSMAHITATVKGSQTEQTEA